MNQLKLIIFDVGGVLRESSKAAHEGIKKGFETIGLNYSFSTQDSWHLRGIGKYNNSRNCITALLAFVKAKKDIRPVLESLNAEEILDKVIAKNIGNEDQKKIDRIREEYKNVFYSPKAKTLIKMFPNEREAIDLLRHNGYKLAIFTNAKVSSVKRDLKELGIKRFSVIVSEENVKHKKPSGEGLLSIMNELGMKPEEVGYVGDSVIDIQAARDVGCTAIALTCGMGLEKHLKAAKPDLLFKNLWEMSQQMA